MLVYVEKVNRNQETIIDEKASKTSIRRKLVQLDFIKKEYKATKGPVPSYAIRYSFNQPLTLLQISVYTNFYKRPCTQTKQ